MATKMKTVIINDESASNVNQTLMTDQTGSKLRQTPTSETRCHQPMSQELVQPRRTTQSFCSQTHAQTCQKVAHFIRPLAKATL